MPNTAILYYSRTGTTRQAAQLLAQRLGCPVFEVFDRVRRAGLWGDLRCIVDNLLRRRVAYCYAGPVLNDYSRLVVMAPVWTGHLAAPMRSYLKDHPYCGQQLAAIVVMAARGGFRAAEEIAFAAGRPPHPTIVVLERDISSGAALPDIEEFANALEGSEVDSARTWRAAWLSPSEA